MQYSKNQQTKRVKTGYGRNIPKKTVNAVIEKQGGRCQFFWEVFGIFKSDFEIHHVFGRRNLHHKHDHANLILLSREVHHAYHHRGFFEHDGVKMYSEDLKQWFINHNVKLYGEKEVNQCK